MINNPQDFFDQVRNLCEELGLRMKAISESLSTYLTKSEAEKYLEKTEASNTYLGKSDKAASASVADSATSANTASRATSDASGNNISSTYLKIATASSTYLTKTEASSSYLGKTAKAESAKTADTATSATSAGSATRAIQDGDGNVISGTYLKSATAQSTYLSKTDASSTYLGKTAKAESAKTADSATSATTATKATQDASGNNIEQTYAKKSEIPEIPEVDTSAFVVKSGGRGELAGYETAAKVAGSTTLTINQDSPDSLWGTIANKITIEQGVAGTSWVKLYYLKMVPFVSVTLGANWYWAGGEVPTFSGGGLLVMAWNGDTGVVNYIYDGLQTQEGGND